MNIEQIQEILPQRYPFLFVDKVVSTDAANRKIICQKNFTINDYFFAGHFPGNPVVPGVIIIEALAQASILLYAAIKPKVAQTKPTYFLGKVEAKFKKAVFPGDSLMLEIEAVKIIETTGIVKAYAKVNGEVVAEAEIGFGIKTK